MDDLVARLEAATAPDRELDIQIALFLGDGLDEKTKASALLPPEDRARRDAIRVAVMVAEYTESIDYALSLVPLDGDGRWWKWHLSGLGYDGGVFQGGKARADVHHPLSSGGGPKWKGFGATPAIALCIAALKARAATLKREET